MKQLTSALQVPVKNEQQLLVLLRQLDRFQRRGRPVAWRYRAAPRTRA